MSINKTVGPSPDKLIYYRNDAASYQPKALSADISTPRIKIRHHDIDSYQTEKALRVTKALYVKGKKVKDLDFRPFSKLTEWKETGFTKVYESTILNPNLNIKEKALLIAYRMYCWEGDNDSCYPSVPTIAKTLGWAHSTVTNLHVKLIEKGFITRQKTNNYIPSRITTLYDKPSDFFYPLPNRVFKLKLRGEVLTVLALLCVLGHGKSYSAYSINKMSALLGIDKKTFSKYLDVLVAKRLITKEKFYWRNSEWRYRFILEQVVIPQRRLFKNQKTVIDTNTGQAKTFKVIPLKLFEKCFPNIPTPAGLKDKGDRVKALRMREYRLRIEREKYRIEREDELREVFIERKNMPGVYDSKLRSKEEMKKIVPLDIAQVGRKSLYLRQKFYPSAGEVVPKKNEPGFRQMVNYRRQSTLLENKKNRIAKHFGVKDNLDDLWEMTIYGYKSWEEPIIFEAAKIRRNYVMGNEWLTFKDFPLTWCISTLKDNKENFPEDSFRYRIDCLSNTLSEEEKNLRLYKRGEAYNRLLCEKGNEAAIKNVVQKTAYMFKKNVNWKTKKEKERKKIEAYYKKEIEKIERYSKKEREKIEVLQNKKEEAQKCYEKKIEKEKAFNKYMEEVEMSMEKIKEINFKGCWVEEKKPWVSRRMEMEKGETLEGYLKKAVMDRRRIKLVTEYYED